jgi:hypothetical protein
MPARTHSPPGVPLPIILAVKINKTKAVRDYMAANRKATPKEVSEALEKEGIEVSPSYVSNIKATAKCKKGKRKRRRQAAEVASMQTGVSIDNIKAAFGLLKQCGGLAQAKEALASAAEIQKVMKRIWNRPAGSGELAGRCRFLGTTSLSLKFSVQSFAPVFQDSGHPAP